ncbi:lysine decarboxylase-like protein-like protein [Lineolata rhizophorae]|uniref:Lysine decarboxylase-like protein-like protein n=1 Tax=Lineolata rhizophorae TaxID=578093 RepID=A0A6A6NTD7_9PEZI|nr:lysine decarboxylase-like protein-like protein [Lineolata rhizophorae]
MPEPESSTAPSSSAVSKGPVVCVFCGARPGNAPAHMAAARALAHAFHAHGIRLVYGGGTVGIMGELAQTLVSLSGPESVHGIIPFALIKHEAGHPAESTAAPISASSDPTDPSASPSTLSPVFGRTTVVKDMHTRKRTMASEVMKGGPGGGFVALSGGYGTLEELMEVTTWNQLGIHGRPVVLFNVDGYWDGLWQWVEKAVEQGFVSEGSKGIMVQASDAEGVVKALIDYKVAEGRFGLDWGTEG